jgi:tRNA threonylcarbamoyl adenosine modification protein YeaZ
MKKIYIDTTDNTKVLVRLIIDKGEFVKEKKVEARSAQLVLPLIEELLKEHELTVQDIESIEVNEGPGSFTGVRVGVSIANALAFALGIPVNNTKIEKGKTLIEPKY